MINSRKILVHAYFSKLLKIGIIEKQNLEN
jgi:hypothetical protein